MQAFCADSVAILPSKAVPPTPDGLSGVGGVSRQFVCDRLTAVGGTAVCERFPRHGVKFPRVACRGESQLQYAVRRRVADLAGRLDGAKRIKPGTASSNDDLAQPA